MHSSSVHLSARARQLTCVHELAQLLTSGTAPRPVLLEVGVTSAADYLACHIPGAGWLDVSRLETGPLFNKVDDAVLLSLLLGLGIAHDTTVILYGHRHQLAAARAAHLMLYAGVRDVRLLDGGLQAWRAARLPCAVGPPRPPVPAASFGAPFPGKPGLLSSTPDVQHCIDRGGAILASIRTWREFQGVTSGYAYIAARGEIPGARWGRAGCDGDVNSMSAYLNAEGCMRSPTDIAAMWAAAGIHPGLPVIFYCGTGWRASLAFFQAYVMGWDRISVYDGGWFEYSSSHSVATGSALALQSVVCERESRRNVA